jgi:cell division protein FtsZ
MVRQDVTGVDFICANTDAQALHNLSAQTRLQLGENITKGLGAGANPDMGKEAALEDKDRIAEALNGADMVFITAGMGGGTGTGAAPIVAEIARSMNILTVAVVTKPFVFEGKKRMALAEAGIAELSRHVDSLITIPNEKLLSIMGSDAPLLQAFGNVDDVLLGAVQGIADLIIRPGMINVDFADVRTVMSEMGMAMMGSGKASGDCRARDAAEAAIHSPLLDDVDFNGATVVVGTVIDPEMGDELRVTVVATGLGRPELEVPRTIVDNTKKKVAGDGAVDYSDFDKPTALRKAAIEGRAEQALDSEKDLDYLDIPAFLRSQAD